MWVLVALGVLLGGCSWFEPDVTGPTVYCDVKTGDTTVAVKCPDKEVH